LLVDDEAAAGRVKLVTFFGNEQSPLTRLGNAQGTQKKKKKDWLTKKQGKLKGGPLQKKRKIWPKINAGSNGR